MNQLKKAIWASAVGAVAAGEEGAIVGHFLFSPDFTGFRGHFPGYPILPALVQVMTAVCVVERATKRPMRLKRMAKAKFHLRIGPSQEIRVECRAVPAGGDLAVDCRVYKAGDLAASFQLTCAPGEGNR